ncbi:MAG: YgiQ family radical SAM protein [Anaerolineaceae bacterium]
MFLPTTPQEVKALEWSSLDVILVSGDSYIDSPYSGVALIGKVLLDAGFHVGVIAQPDITSDVDITRLGEPRLFWGVSSGTVDSMVANYTATLHKRRTDDFTPGGLNNRRPDRAVISYSNLIRRYFKNTAPIVLGGIEASLRRITHYDYWTDKLRAPILFDSKADFLIYGMGERSIIEFTQALRDKVDPRSIRGLAYLSHSAPTGYIVLPTFEEVCGNKKSFTLMFDTFYKNNDSITAHGLVQKKADRFYVQNPPQPPLTQQEMDKVYALPFERKQHPFYEDQGSVKALETIRFSISTHRGCYGECNFCAIAVHEGRTVSSRSENSILFEAKRFTKDPAFKGIIQDIGGPTANMYAIECAKKLNSGACTDKRCLFPDICPVLKLDHSRQIDLLKKIRLIPGVKKAFVGSGIRYDLVMADKEFGQEYLKQVTQHHTSGQMKIAPEHTDPVVLRLMGKPPINTLVRFKEAFDRLSHDVGKDQYLTYYLIAAYPGCSDREMKNLKDYATRELHIAPEQVQVFTPTPSTYASVMYYTETDPFTGKPLFIEKNLQKKVKQKEIVTAKPIAGIPVRLPRKFPLAQKERR